MDDKNNFHFLPSVFLLIALSSFRLSLFETIFRCGILKVVSTMRRAVCAKAHRGNVVVRQSVRTIISAVNVNYGHSLLYIIRGILTALKKSTRVSHETKQLLLRSSSPLCVCVCQ